jgi:hypothetical protein
MNQNGDGDGDGALGSAVGAGGNGAVASVPPVSKKIPVTDEGKD